MTFPHFDGLGVCQLDAARTTRIPSQIRTSVKGKKFPVKAHERELGDEVRSVDKDGFTHVGNFVELYHGTSRQRANLITKRGFRIRAVKKATMGGDPESSRDYVWFAKQQGTAERYSRMHRNSVVIVVRIPKKLLDKLNPYNRYSGPEAFWSPQEIPAKYIHSIVAPSGYLSK